MAKEKERRRAAEGTKQATDQEAAAWDIPYSRAEFNGGIETDSVGNPYDEDPMGEDRTDRRSRARE